MEVSILETSGLGDRSYLISEGGTAVAVDPQRDIDRLLAIAGELNVRITHVLETHIHNDYVTGGLELARVTGAEYVVPGGEDVDYPRRAIVDGDIIDAGPIRLRAIHTPGHTDHHVSYVLIDGASDAVAVFTGGSLLHGSTGRTDLLGAEHTEDLSHAQFHSARKLARELPAATTVYPTHGFGSFCSATPTAGDSSTIGEQRVSNPALTQDEETYVAELLAGLAEYPAYYAHMGVINRAGPDPVDLSTPEPVDPGQLRSRIDAGEWIVDLRHRTAFAAGHLGGSFGFELSGSFVAYIGWLYAWGAPLTLIGDSDDQIADGRRELARIGIDNIVGATSKPVDVLAGGTPLRSYRVADFAALAAAQSDENAAEIVVLDVRQLHEYRKSHLRGAHNIPIHELTDRIGELPTGQVWVHCASGYRASIAASLLDHHGRAVVLVDDEFANADSVALSPAPD